MKLIGISVALCVALFSLQVEARDVEVKITKQKPYSSVLHGTEQVKRQRIQDTGHVIDGSFAKTSRPCPPFCVNPMSIAEGVETVAELEVIEFMETAHYRGYGTIIDVRTPSWHNRGTIPGSINIPFTVFEKPADDPELAEVLESLGVRERDEVGAIQSAIESLGFFDGDSKTDQWDFTGANNLVLWCNGPWCGQSPRAIKALVKLGYPEDKLKYYRGGMQMWQSLGLTTALPAQTNKVAAFSN